MRSTIAAVSIAIVVALSACGSSGPDSKGEAPPAAPAKAEPPAAKTEPPAKAPTGDVVDAAAPDADTKAPPPSEPVATTEISPTRALVLQKDALVRLAPSGKTETVVTVPKLESCQVDDDHRVVWLVSDTELFVWDLERPGLKKVATGIVAPGGHVSWQVQREEPPSPFNVVTAGNVDGYDECVALVIEIGAKPSIGGRPIAEGDREWYCYEEETIASDDPELIADEAKVDAGYDKAKLVDAALLVALDTRRKDEGKRSRPALEAPAAPTVTIDRARCEEEPTACGSTEYIGGGRLWWVITANSRGDFFHETRQIYDSTTKAFWDPATDARAPSPGEGEEGVRLHASPDGTWGIYKDQILALSEAKATGPFTATFCGWE